jgi:hypothetical protein
VSVQVPNPDIKDFKKRYDEVKNKEKEEEEKKKREAANALLKKDSTLRARRDS